MPVIRRSHYGSQPSEPHFVHFLSSASSSPPQIRLQRIITLGGNLFTPIILSNLLFESFNPLILSLSTFVQGPERQFNSSLPQFRLWSTIITRNRKFISLTLNGLLKSQKKENKRNDEIKSVSTHRKTLKPQKYCLNLSL